MDKQQLIDFEKWVVETYKEGRLRSPVHLSGGNEEQLIDIFKDIKPQDWVFTTYRSHYHALLKGVPEDRLKAWILDNKSIHFMDSEHKVFSSAIVGGCLPIALGVAMLIKTKQQELLKMVQNLEGEDWKVERDSVRIEMQKHVYCFIGDMTASLGVFKDCLEYAENFELPITIVIENNDLSTDTNTGEAWNMDSLYMEDYFIDREEQNAHVKHYRYKRVYPHYGIGEFVEFKDEQLKQDGKSF